MKKVLYLCPELDSSSGGVDQIHQHVLLLRNAGVDAYVVHFTGGFRWPFAPDVPSAAITELAISPQDHLVLPEGWILPELLELPIETHVFFQGVLGVFGDKNAARFEKLPSPDNYLCCSELLVSMVDEFIGGRPTLVPNAVDMNLFSPAKKTRSIAFMPRKEPRLLDAVKGFFTSSFPDSGIEWIPIAGMSKPEVATVLSKAELFLFTGFFEGFGMPPLEAMASGAIVVGTHGYGGLEYTDASNGFWTNLGDIPGLVRGLKSAVSLVRDHPEKAESMCRAGMATAKRYSVERQQKALLGYWLPRLDR